MGGMQETHGHQNALVSMGVVVQETHGHQNVLVWMGVVQETELQFMQWNLSGLASGLSLATDNVYAKRAVTPIVYKPSP